MELIHAIQQKRLNTKVVVLTMHEDESKVRLARSYGARSYILKNSTLRELIGGLQKVERGEIFVSRQFGHGSRSNGNHSASEANGNGSDLLCPP